MPISRIRLQINRQNTYKSTRPKTRCGKTISGPGWYAQWLYCCDSIADPGCRKEDSNEHKRQKNSALSKAKPKQEREFGPKHKNDETNPFRRNTMRYNRLNGFANLGGPPFMVGFSR